MAADYNEMAPDGSWRHVTQNPDGSYNRTPIPPSDYAAANIPGGSGGGTGGISDVHRHDLQVAGYGDWSNPNLTEADYAQIAAGAQAGTGGAEAFNPAYYGLIQQGVDNTVKNDLSAADKIRNLIQTYGDQAYQFLAKAGELGVSVADVMSRLTGPANAFAYDRAANAFRGNGLGDSVQALQSGFKAPSFGALGVTSPMTLASLGNDVAGGPGTGTGTGGSIIDQLLGLAGSAEQGYQNASNGKVPFSIPQFDAQGKLIPGTGSVNNQTAVTAPGGGSDGLYQTSNGPKTVAQMLAELDTAAGGQWKDGDRNSATAIASAYAHTTGGTVTPPQTATASQTAASSGVTRLATGNPVPLSGSGDTGAGPVFSAPTASLGGDTGADSGFKAPTAPATTPTTGRTGATAPAGTPMPGGITRGPLRIPTALDQYSPDVRAYLLSLPDPSQVNARDYTAMDPSQQSLVKAGYSALGYDPVSLESQWSAMLPQFKAPSFGLVS